MFILNETFNQYDLETCNGILSISNYYSEIFRMLSTVENKVEISQIREKKDRATRSFVVGLYSNYSISKTLELLYFRSSIPRMFRLCSLYISCLDLSSAYVNMELRNPS